MANIINGEKIVLELIQGKANDQNIYSECKKILSDNKLYSSIKNRLSLLKEKLGHLGASQKAAQIIYQAMNEL